MVTTQAFISEVAKSQRQNQICSIRIEGNICVDKLNDELTPMNQTYLWDLSFFPVKLLCNYITVGRKLFS